MPILTTRTGLEVLRFVPTGSPTVPADDLAVPLTWTTVVARYGTDYVLAYNHVRQQWELPGGGIEPGETPAQAAIRELQEESSQVAAWVTCKGVFKGRAQDSGKTEYAALFYTELDTLRPFICNAETNRLTTCSPANDPDAVLASFSRFMIRMAQPESEANTQLSPHG